MARVYAFLVDDAPYPDEIELARALKEHGAKAITGREILSAREIRDCRMAEYAENIITIYRAREASENWAEWEANNKRQAELLAHVHKVYLAWQTP